MKTIHSKYVRENTNRVCRKSQVWRKAHHPVSKRIYTTSLRCPDRLRVHWSRRCYSNGRFGVVQRQRRCKARTGQEQKSSHQWVSTHRIRWNPVIISTIYSWIDCHFGGREWGWYPPRQSFGTLLLFFLWNTIVLFDRGKSLNIFGT